MERKSNVFNIGQRIEGTMLTILGPVEPSTWMTIRCLCDCGQEIVLSYHQVYYRRFSCGCKRRERFNAVDYAGFEAYNSAGNRNRGRKLTVIARDDAGQWQYLCHCCNQLYAVPRGMERGLDRSLKDLAGRECPNYRVLVQANRFDTLTWLIPDRNVIGRANIAKVFAKYCTPDQIERNLLGEITGFYIKPDATPRDYGCPCDTWAEAQDQYAQIENRQAEVIESDPDGFASEFVGFVDDTND
jgi:hypothetical protein